MEDDKMLDIPHLLCKCGNLLSSESVLGEYIHVFEPSISNLPSKEAGRRRKKFFISKNLHRLCCWNKMQTYYDPMKTALLDVKRI